MHPIYFCPRKLNRINQVVQTTLMNSLTQHSFHIPVMGLGYTIDTPVKVARFGISSVVSIIQDHLIEQMREHHAKKFGEPFESIPEDDIDHRAKRITAYLDLLQRIVDQQVVQMKREPFEDGYDIVRYFELLPENSPNKRLYHEMTRANGDHKQLLQEQLKARVVAGNIDVNIMTKLDNPRYTKANTPLPLEFADAMSALRGYGQSSIASSIVFSAGLNPRLFSYAASFPDFFPNRKGYIKKEIVLKVSDYRSALIQGKFLAKKGLWISEFRVESGLNCGGHAFPTEGRLMGPILEEFKNKKHELDDELRTLCNRTLLESDRPLVTLDTDVRITVQGGIGTANEDLMLREYYHLNGTGWGSPFLLVPEATTVDDKTLQKLVKAKQEDYYLSNASPLGVPFNNFKQSSSETQRKERIARSRPGSPCYLKFLSFDTEFKEQPICVASREYQHLKLKQLAESDLPQDQIESESERVLEKDCLCEGLSVSALLKNGIPDRHKLEAVSICPGPNLAYFSSVYSLDDMVSHIYGRKQVLNSTYRKHMFLNELKMYMDYLKDELDRNVASMTRKKVKYFTSFKSNLLNGIAYYKELFPRIEYESQIIKMQLKKDLDEMETTFCEFVVLKMNQFTLQEKVS